MILGELEGYLLLGTFGIVMILVTWIFSKRISTKIQEFMVANRRIGVLAGAFSIASSWIWAPSLFVAAQKAYEQGIPGVFWFTFPNMLTLIVFAPLAGRIRKLMPEGYTLPEYIKTRFDTKTHIAYMFSFLSLQVCSFGVQLLAGASLIHLLTGIAFWKIAFLFAMIALVYSLISGLKASVLTDFLQMTIILLVILIMIPMLLYKTQGFSSIIGGLGGISGKFTNLFDPLVAYTFGIVVTIGLLSGPIGDQQHWQRAFALKKNAVKKAFVLSAFVFVIVPLSLSTLGFVGANPTINEGWIVEDTQLIGVITVSNLLPNWVLVLFIYMLLAGLSSTLDSVLCASSSIGGIDIYRTYINKNASEKRILYVSRVFMLVITLSGLGISLIPGMKILYLFLFYGTLRAATMLPTILSLYWGKLNTNGVFLGVVLSSLIGLPIFAIGLLISDATYQVLGSIYTILIGLFCCVIFTLIKPEKVNFSIFTKN